MANVAEINRIISDSGIDAQIERSDEDASYALDRPLVIADAQRLVDALESAGVEASYAPDQGDDRDSDARWWVHVTVSS